MNLGSNTSGPGYAMAQEESEINPVLKVLHIMNPFLNTSDFDAEDKAKLSTYRFVGYSALGALTLGTFLILKK